MYDIDAVANGAWVPGPYGAGDQLGTYNEVTPEKRAAAWSTLKARRATRRSISATSSGTAIRVWRSRLSAAARDRGLCAPGRLWRDLEGNRADGRDPAQLPRGACPDHLQHRQQGERTPPLWRRRSLLQRIPRPGHRPGSRHERARRRQLGPAAGDARLRDRCGGPEGRAGKERLQIERPGEPGRTTTGSRSKISKGPARAGASRLRTR